MTALTLKTLSPFVALVVAMAIWLAAMAVRRSHALSAAIASLGLATGLVAFFVCPEGSVWPLFTLDPLARGFGALALTGALGSVLLSVAFLDRNPVVREELHALLLLAALGAAALAAARHFVLFFLALELLSISLYGLLAYLSDREAAVEAGIKYLVLGAASSAGLIFGLALLYAHTGELDLDRLPLALREGGDSPIAWAGLALVAVGLGFKLALAPFHFWAPEVYQGAPAPVVAFLATGAKAAALAAVLRFSGGEPRFAFLLAVLAGASMLVGNLLALQQQSLKRLLGCSAIAHMGYALLGALGGSTASVLTYMLAYTAASLAAFGALAALDDGRPDYDRLERLRGLWSEHPWLAAALGLALLSLAGIPLTGGFVGKLLVLQAAADASRWILVFLLAISSAIGVYYYLRAIIALFMEPAVESREAKAGLLVGLTLAASAAGLLWIGLYPASVL